MLHHGTRGAVRAFGRVSEEFDIITGVRQGDVLAPTLFNLFFDAIIVTALARHPHCGVKILYNLGDELVGSRKRMRGNVLIQDLEYPDDMVIIVSDSMDALDEVLRSMNVVCSSVGLSISSEENEDLGYSPRYLLWCLKPTCPTESESRACGSSGRISVSWQHSISKLHP